MTQTLLQFFEKRSQEFEKNDFLIIPRDESRLYHPQGYQINFGQASQVVRDWMQVLDRAGYGHGHRVAVLLGNRPEMLLLKLALSGLGISWVPVNPDYRPEEVRYLLQDSGAVLAIASPELLTLMKAGIDLHGEDLPLVVMDTGLADLPVASRVAPLTGPVTPESESSLVYTSGTTGRPKGCVLSHDYEISMGEWYATRGGLIDFKSGKTRIYCPLPLFHVNAAILCFMAVIETGSAEIIPERFRASAWWRELAQTKATAAHYLGIVIPALMNREAEPYEKECKIEWAVGAGVEPTLHRAFEERFGFPLIEVWGMSEMCRMLADCHEPRMIDTRAFGRPQPGLDVRVVDENDNEVARGVAGEMTIRYDANTPRRGAFSEYLNLPEETEKVWRGGWFHTGDTVMMDETDMIFFVDRKKNIIRRSGENIAAAEIEACLQEHEAVERVAVIAVEDAMRDEEVMACVQLKSGSDTIEAKDLFEWCFKRLAYYKAPGWVQFMDDIPVTGTQKIQKHAMFGDGVDPTQDAVDFRNLKRRG